MLNESKILRLSHVSTCFGETFIKNNVGLIVGVVVGVVVLIVIIVVVIYKLKHKKA